MIPIKLKFTAFGPYPTEQVIDFRELQNNKMFVITGPTGSGKTTIFDAMSFALYGNASGSERNSNMFRSDFANDETLTAVEFEFEIQNKTYKVTRTPIQRRPKLRGSGMRTIDGTVLLEYDDVKLTSHLEVSEKLEEILGLSKEQFKQIVLLPQGEFKRLLVSDSRAKEEIFRKIFNTSHIKKIQDKLNTSANTLKRQIENSELQISTIYKAYTSITNTNQLRLLEGNLLKNISDLSDYLKSTDANLNKLQSKLIMHQEYLKDMDVLSQIELKLDNYKKNKEKYEIYQDFIENTIIIQNYKQACKQHDNLIVALTKLDIDKVKFEDELNKLNQKLITYNQECEIASFEYQQLDSKRDELKVLETRLTEINIDIQTVKQIEETTVARARLESENLDLITDLKKLEELLTLAIENSDIYNSNLELLKNLNDKLNQTLKKLEVSSEITKLEKLNQDYSVQAQNLNSELSEANLKLSNYRSVYFNNQAAILAQNLTDDAPCPVCGSLEHPHPAIVTDTQVSYEMIEIKEQDCLQLSTQITNITSNINNNNQNIARLIQEYQIDDSDYNLECQTLQSKISKLNETNENLKNAIDQTQLQTQLEKQKLKQIEIKMNIEKYQFLISDLQGKLKFDRSELGKQDQICLQIKELKKQIEQIESNYQNAKQKEQETKSLFENYNYKITQTQIAIKDYQIEINDYKQEISNIQQSFKLEMLNTYMTMLEDEAQIRNEYNNYITDYALLISKQVELTEKVKNYKVIKIEDIKKQIHNLQIIKESHEQISDECKALAKRVNTDLITLDDIDRSSGKLIEKYKLIADISDVANGKTISKISFERYMLSIYFKQIIERANFYFKTMTNNRFALEYKTPSKSRGAGGLDLNVVDYYTSKVRDIKSLSGGESFKAALAMALGLSDIVQMNSGGIQINTIFIDEGFGSLDIDSLNIAIDTLISIESEGRIVGIISHVEELKNQINNKVEVIPSPSGSKLKTSFN